MMLSTFAGRAEQSQSTLDQVYNIANLSFLGPVPDRKNPGDIKAGEIAAHSKVVIKTK
jgi:hypothetical protein